MLHDLFSIFADLQFQENQSNEGPLGRLEHNVTAGESTRENNEIIKV